MLPQVDFSTYPSQIFWAISAFAILYFMISRFIVPTFEEILINRTKNIEDNIRDADLLFKEISTLKKDYDININNAKNEANIIRNQKLDKFNGIQQAANSKLKDELEVLRITTLDDIEKNMSEFKASQKEHIINLAGFMIQKILKKQPDHELLAKCYRKII